MARETELHTELARVRSVLRADASTSPARPVPSPTAQPRRPRCVMAEASGSASSGAAVGAAGADAAGTARDAACGERAAEPGPLSRRAKWMLDAWDLAADAT